MCIPGWVRCIKILVHEMYYPQWLPSCWCPGRLVSDIVWFGVVRDHKSRIVLYCLEFCLSALCRLAIGLSSLLWNFVDSRIYAEYGNWFSLQYAWCCMYCEILLDPLFILGPPSIRARARLPFVGSRPFVSLCNKFV